MKSVKKTLKKYFIPHAENDHKPHFLRGQAVSVTALLVVVLFAASVVGNYAVRHNAHLAAVQAAFIVDLTNEDRKDAGLKKLVISKQLVSAADMKAKDMSSKRYFAHISPEGRTPWYWIDLSGYKYIYAGENLAVNFTDSSDVEDAWMDSPTHKANILHKKFTEIGIATSPGIYKGEKTIFVVQMFGSPKKSAVVNPARVSAVPDTTAVAEEPVQLASAPQAGSQVSQDEEVLGEELQVSQNSGSANNTPASPAPVQGFEEMEDPYMTVINEDVTPEEILASEEEVFITENSDLVYTNWFERILVSPSKVVRDLYITLAALVAFSLILKIFIEIRLQHARSIIYGLVLLLIIGVFMHINASILTQPILVVAF